MIGRRRAAVRRLGLLGIEPFLEAKLVTLRGDASIATLHANDLATLRDAPLDVVVASADHPGVEEAVRESGDIPVVVVAQRGETVPEGATTVDRPVSSPRLQLALDEALGVGRVRRFARSLAVEQDDHDIVQRYFFLIRVVATLFSLGWIGANLDVMPAWTLLVMAGYAVIRSLWWRQTTPALLFDIAAVTPIAFVAVMYTGGTPAISVVLPVIIWIQTGYQLRLWRALGVLAATTAVLGVIGWLAWGIAIPVAALATPSAMAVLGVATGAMMQRVVDSDVSRRRQDLERFRASLYDLSERQSAVALSFDLGTAAEEVLARLVHQTGARAAVVLVAEPGALLTVAAAHNLTKPPPTRLTWAPATTTADVEAGSLADASVVAATDPHDLLLGPDTRGASSSRTRSSPETRVKSVAGQLAECLPSGRVIALPAVIDEELLGGIVLVEPHGTVAPTELREAAVEAALAFDSVRLFNRLRAFTLDQERARIGRSLHDGVMQTLSHVGMQLDMAVRDGEIVATPESLATLRENVVATIAEMRAVVNEMRSVRLDRGLQAALETMAVTVAPAGGPLITVDADPGVELDPQVEEQLLRITQEVVSNAVRHAEAERIDVTLHRRGESVVLRIADDGVGLSATNSNRVASEGGVGMTSIRQRAHAIDARIDVDPGPGVVVEVTYRPHRRLGYVDDTSV